MFSFVTARTIIEQADEDEKVDAVRSIYYAFPGIGIYLGATGVGLVAGGQTTPVALRELGVLSADARFALTTIIGLGSRFAGYSMLAQVWAFIDPLSVLFVFLWHVIYLLSALGSYLKYRSVVVLCWILYVIILAIAIVRFIDLAEGNEIILAPLGFIVQNYLTSFMLPALIPNLVIGYFTSTLTRLVLLQVFVPLSDEQESQERIELVEVADPGEPITHTPMSA